MEKREKRPYTNEDEAGREEREAVRCVRETTRQVSRRKEHSLDQMREVLEQEKKAFGADLVLQDLRRDDAQALRRRERRVEVSRSEGEEAKPCVTRLTVVVPTH